MSSIEERVTDPQAKAILKSLAQKENIPNESFVFLEYDRVMREYRCEQIVVAKFVEQALTSDKPQGFVPWYVAYAMQNPKKHWSDADLEQHRTSGQPRYQ